MKLMYLVMVVFIAASFGIDYLNMLGLRMILRGVLEVISLFVLAPHVFRSMRRDYAREIERRIRASRDRAQSHQEQPDRHTEYARR